MHRLLLLLLVPGIGLAETKPWPNEFKTRPIKMAFGSDAKSGNQIVTTEHFRMVSETQIARQEFTRFAKVVESVPQLIEGFPLPLWAPPSKGKIDIFFFTDESKFVKAGGTAGAVGWWDGIRRRALIRSDYFLAPPRGGNSRLQPRPDQDLLVHEMVHMSMAGILWRLPPWFFEGTAEYFAVCHQGDGWYMFRDIDRMIRDHLRRALAVNKVGEKYHLVSAEKVLKYDHRAWLAETRNEFNGNAYLPYATGLLLAHYHFHGGQARRDTVASHLTKLKTLGRRTKTPPFPTGSGKEIEERLVKYWSQKGLHLVFEK